MKTLLAFKTAFHILKKDRVALLLALLPIIIGLTGLYFFSEWFFVELKEMIVQQFGGEWRTSRFLQGAVFTLLAAFYYLIVNLLFVIVVSIVASPFNDLLCARIGAQLGEIENKGNSAIFLKRWLQIWFNELKKIVCLGCLSIFSLLLGFFPPLIPLSIALSSLLLAISFLDYNWNRQDLPLSQCLRDIRRHCCSYGLSGFLFLSAFTIPIINIFLVPFAVVYYTILSIEAQKKA